MRNEAPSRDSLAPRRGPDGKFTSGITKVPAENDNDTELLDLSDEEMIEEEPVTPKKPAPPKITQAELRAADERRAAARAKDQNTAKRLQKNIAAYDPMDPTWVAALDAADPQRVAERRAKKLQGEFEKLDPMSSERLDPMHPARIASMDVADPQRAAERRAKKLQGEFEKLDPMSSERLDPMHPARIASMDVADPQRAAERRKRNFDRVVDKLDPMDPRRLAHTLRPKQARETESSGGNPTHEYRALLAENKILEYINTLKSEYAARYGADLDKISRGHETIGESFRAWRRDIRPMQGLGAMLKGIGSFFQKESLEETLKNSRTAKETKEHYINEYDQAQAELAQSRNARRLGKQPKVSSRYLEE